MKWKLSKGQKKKLMLRPDIPPFGRVSSDVVTASQRNAIPPGEGEAAIHIAIIGFLTPEYFREALRAVWKQLWATSRPNILPSLLGLAASACKQDWFNAFERIWG